MSKLVKGLTILAVIATAIAFAPNAAEARGGHAGGHGGWHGGGWRGGWAFGPAVGLGIGVGYGWGWGFPYGYYARPYYPRPVYRTYYYAEPRCGYERVRVWRHGHWVIRTIRRCWY